MDGLFIGNEGQDRIVAGFGLEHHARLCCVKARHDLETVFRPNRNERPEAAVAAD